jgi:hypothetical protein
MITGASFVAAPAGTPNGTSTTPLAEFPSEGSSFGILTTGNVKSVPNTATFASTDLHGGNIRGNTDFDVTLLKADLTVQPGANCLTFDFKFLSEEYPGFVNTGYNDAFVAELDTSTWTTSGSTITAPNDFAFDGSHQAVSINSTGLGSMSAANGAGTAYNGTQSYNANFFAPPGNAGGATGLLHASTQVTPGSHSIYFSIFDQGDHRLDSAAFLDNLTVGFVPNPSLNCVPGATPVNFKLSLSPASATSPVETTHTVTARLTDAKGTSIPSAPVDFTVTGPNSTSGSGTTDPSGDATFTYTGTALGSDMISACYEPSGSPCAAVASATKTWVKASPSISTTAANPVPAGGIASDSATISGGSNPGGSVTFQLFAPGDTACQTPIASQDATLAAGIASSGSVGVGGPGTYNWVATYNGDAANNAVTSPCGSEPVIVTGQRMTGRASGLSATVTSFLGTLTTVSPTPDTGAISTTSSSSTSTPCVATLGDLLSARVLCANITTDGFPGKSTASASLAEAAVGTLDDSCVKSDSSMKSDSYSFLKKTNSSKSDACTKTDSSNSFKSVTTLSYTRSRSDDESPALPTMTVRAVKSTSTTTCDGSSGATTIAYLAVGNRVVISVPTQVAPNTRITVGLVKLVLNEQIRFSTPDKGLTVNGVHATINALGLAKVDVVVASSESDIGNCP